MYSIMSIFIACCLVFGPVDSYPLCNVQSQETGCVINTTKKPQTQSETKSVWGVYFADHMTITWLQEGMRIYFSCNKNFNLLSRMLWVFLHWWNILINILSDHYRIDFKEGIELFSMFQNSENTWASWLFKFCQ